MQIRHTPLSGGYCGGVPPLPIPNREVKPTCADGTAIQCGRVGRRLLSMKSLRFRKIFEAFLFFFPRIFFFSAGVILLRGAFTSDFFFIVFYRDFSSSDFTDDADFFSLIILVPQISRIHTDFFSLIIFLMDLHGFSLIIFFFL